MLSSQVVGGIFFKHSGKEKHYLSVLSRKVGFLWSLNHTFFFSPISLWKDDLKDFLHPVLSGLTIFQIYQIKSPNQILSGWTVILEPQGIFLPYLESEEAQAGQLNYMNTCVKTNPLSGQGKFGELQWPNKNWFELPYGNLKNNNNKTRRKTLNRNWDVKLFGRFYVQHYHAGKRFPVEPFCCTGIKTIITEQFRGVKRKIITGLKARRALSKKIHQTNKFQSN